MEVSRGDLITVALVGDYGKLRPALVVQNTAFQGLESVMVLPLSSDLRDWPLFRVTMEPTPENGLQRRSQVMIDKAATVPRMKIGQLIGRAEIGTMREVNTALGGFLGLS
jgi:mRNA interferase MazF